MLFGRPRKSKTKVVNIHKEKCDVYIGRAKRGQPDNILGNPFPMQSGDSRETVISKYASYFLKRWEHDEVFRGAVLRTRNKKIGCFCHPKPCHGDLIKAFTDTYFEKGMEKALEKAKTFVRHLHFRKGDLFNTPDPIIVHGCNCEGVMGAGVAKTIKLKYPEAFKKYKEACDSGEFNPGDILPVVVSSDKIIVNLASQEEFRHSWENNDRRLAKLEHIEKGLNEMVRRLEAKYQKTKSKAYLNVSMPMIGCGLGGLKEEDVIPLIEKVLENSMVTITIYTN